MRTTLKVWARIALCLFTVWLVLTLAGCDGWLVGPLFRDSGDGAATGALVVTVPCHDDTGRTFPCPPAAVITPDSSMRRGEEPVSP